MHVQTIEDPQNLFTAKEASGPLFLSVREEATALLGLARQLPTVNFRPQYLYLQLLHPGAEVRAWVISEDTLGVLAHTWEGLGDSGISVDMVDSSGRRECTILATTGLVGMAVDRTPDWPQAIDDPISFVRNALTLCILDQCTGPLSPQSRQPLLDLLQ